LGSALGLRQAFTLVELMMAVAIVAILSYVLLPSVDSISAQRLNSVSRILAADFEPRAKSGDSIQHPMVHPDRPIE
jgi:prepilin-type N-terminal cleavage/methylation domain-containing protein